MPTLSKTQIGDLIAPYLQGAPPGPHPALTAQLQTYLDLLLRWNARTNLTSIRNPEQIVPRHFGESLFAGIVLSRELGPTGNLLDLGSGAGFPGLPIQLLLPQWHVTLAESQGKKAAFLREVVRALGLNTEVWAGRVEAMPPHRLFDAVAMRAVDKMAAMEPVARQRLTPGGYLLRLTTGRRDTQTQHAIPGTQSTFVELSRPSLADVPRGT